jgi:hypothetical protein
LTYPTLFLLVYYKRNTPIRNIRSVSIGNILRALGARGTFLRLPLSRYFILAAVLMPQRDINFGSVVGRTQKKLLRPRLAKTF